MKNVLNIKDNNGFVILELSSMNKVTGRTSVKFIIHEIFNDPSQYNKNGISWNEQYTLNNIGSAKGMPICVEFLDYERSEPYGHGLTGIVDSQPIYELSTMVGVFENAYIDTVDLNGRSFKALIGEGYVNEQRYPKFVQWLKAQKFDNKVIESSVEISKQEANNVIIYDGGWKEKGRVPQIYDYTGHAILGIDPADDSAVLLELNHNSKKKEDNRMNENEKLILELNNKIEAKIADIADLNSKVQEKDATISELNTKVEAQTTEINELTTSKVEAETQVAELNEKVTGMEAELNELRQFKQEATNKELVTELNTALSDFTDEEKVVVKEKVENFSANPSKEGIAAIISEINSAIVSKVMEQRKAGKSHEQNSHQAGDIESDIYEVSSSVSDLADEDGLY